MAVGIESYLNTYYNPFSGSTSSTSSLGFDPSGMNVSKQEAQAMVDAYKNNNTSVKTLKKDTADFLDKYAAGMKKMDQAANSVRLDSLDKLLYNSDGEVTDETVAATVKAVQNMASEYNNMMKLLNDNSTRGPGVTKQLGRMVTDPAPAAGMKLVGITVNDDGTLAVDADKLTESLKTTDKNQLDLYKDLIGGWGGVADGIHKRALFGEQASAQSLISNDLASIKSAQSENPFREMYSSMRGNAYALNNQAVVGMMMNMLV